MPHAISPFLLTHLCKRSRNLDPDQEVFTIGTV